MATDGPDPTPCDQEIFQKGEGVCVVTGGSNAIENWVQQLGKITGEKVDWHFSGGRGNVLHLGDAEGRERVLIAIQETKANLNGELLSAGQPALFRRGVDTAPKGAIAYDPATRSFM